MVTRITVHFDPQAECRCFEEVEDNGNYVYYGDYSALLSDYEALLHTNAELANVVEDNQRQISGLNESLAHIGEMHSTLQLEYEERGVKLLDAMQKLAPLEAAERDFVVNNKQMPKTPYQVERAITNYQARFKANQAEIRSLKMTVNDLRQKLRSAKHKRRKTK